MKSHVFVARENELAQLDGLLEQARAGHGSVCFVTGQAGSGKTTLVREFARLAQEEYDDLAVAVGQSDAQTGEGDPHLPFRELLGQLTGDVEAKLAQGEITEENAGRLRKLLVVSGQALVEVGPDLIGIFVPGAGLAARVGAFAAGKVGWLDKLEKLIGKGREATGPGEPGIQPSHIFEQYGNVLARLAEKQPLLLVLDDLQWADAASLGLLFRLARRIEGQRILLLGTYRPEEVAIGRSGERHPLEKVLAELKRYYGDMSVDLDRAEELEGRHFVDAYLDTEPNRLEAGFREKLFRHTGGHPLFTIELLRNMQERGDLVPDEAGRWVEVAVLDWESLPERVEGVIEERIGRLEWELRQVLTVGSIEGEDFTAEVVARVQAADVAGLVRRLSGELERQHRLVMARGLRRLDPAGQRLSLYRFQHNLFQRYLYHELDEAERAYLHEDVGNALEELYGDRVDEIVVQLARHFDEAGRADKAVHYLRRAGVQAAGRFANDEAITYFSRALDLAPAAEPDVRYTLLLGREQVYDVQGARDHQAQDLAALHALTGVLGVDRYRAEIALRQAAYASATGDFSAAVANAQEATRLAQSVRDTRSQATGHLLWGRALRYQAEYQGAHEQLERAHSLAQAGQVGSAEANSLCAIGEVLSRQGDGAAAGRSFEQALEIFRELGDLRGEAQVLKAHCGSLVDYGDYSGAQVRGEAALGIYQRIGHREGQTGVLGNLGIICAQQGDYARAGGFFRQALRISREIGDRHNQAAVLNNLGNLAQRQGDYSEARENYEQVLEICREIGTRRGEGITLNNLGTVSEQQGDYDAATGYHAGALDIFREIGDRRSETPALNNLGDLYRAQGKFTSARACLEQSLCTSQEVGDRRGESCSLRALGVLSISCGRYPEAETCLARSLEVVRQISDRQLEGKVLADQGWLYHCLGREGASLECSEEALQIGREVADRNSQARALTFLGHAHLARQSPAEAAEAYRQSLALRRELAQPHLATETLAGLARVSLSQGDPSEAQALVDEILAVIESRGLAGTDEPLRVYLTCYRTLAASHDPRAAGLLETGHRLLQERAAKIADDETRRSYLENVAAHRELVREFAETG
jgi:predicted ATPase/uncharacterized protein HemY